MKLTGKKQAQVDADKLNVLADQVRRERDGKIAAVQWRRDRHNDELALGVTPTEPLEPILKYIEDLRDIPQQVGFPDSIVWPVEP